MALSIRQVTVPMKRITVNREKMLAGEPCWDVDGETFPGFSCRGVLTVHARDGRSWMEWTGDDEDFDTSGGAFHESSSVSTQRGFNTFLDGVLHRVDSGEVIVLGVNRPRVMGRLTAVTAYDKRGSYLVPSASIIGRSWSVTARPALPRPLSAWIEGVGALRAM